MNNKKLWIALIIAFFLAGVAGSYLLFHNFSITSKQTVSAPASLNESAEPEEIFSVRMFYPSGDHLQPVEKRLPRRTKQTSIAEAVAEEYLKGPSDGRPSEIPSNVKVLGLYRDQGQTLYIDLSDEVRRNFRGDSLSEYLFIKGLYESLLANLSELQDVKILVEGKEIESLGGHFYLKYPLKSTVSHEYKGDKKTSDE